MAREEGREVGCYANGTDARTATAMGNAEGLMQVKVAYIGPNNLKSNI